MITVVNLNCKCTSFSNNCISATVITLKLQTSQYSVIRNEKLKMDTIQVGHDSYKLLSEKYPFISSQVSTQYNVWSVHNGMLSTSGACHEYIRWCSVPRRYIMSTLGGYHEHTGGCQDLCGRISWVNRAVFSTSGISWFKCVSVRVCVCVGGGGGY